MVEQKIALGFTYIKSCNTSILEKRILLPIEVIVNRDWISFIKTKICDNFDPTRKKKNYSDTVERDNTNAFNEFV